jgi:hypothetical protein
MWPNEVQGHVKLGLLVSGFKKIVVLLSSEGNLEGISGSIKLASSGGWADTSYETSLNSMPFL